MKVELINISKRFIHSSMEVKVFDHLNLTIPAGQFVVIMGPNGCGKTTLLNLISGIDKDFEGKITVMHKSTQNACAYLMQKDLLLPWKTVYQNIIIGLEIQKKISISTQESVMEYLHVFGMVELANKYPNCLSGGERQKVALIRTLIMYADIILLDEPFSSIDYITRLELQEKVYNIVKKNNKTAIMITHDIDEALSVADRVIILDHKPQGILKDLVLNFSIEKRNPLTTREHNKFSILYSKIWETLPK